MTLCEYGCGNEAKYQFKNGKWCCSKSHNKCPINKKKVGDSNRKPLIKPKMKNGIILCEYGCERKAKYQFKNGKWCCSNSHMKCPALKEKRRNITLDFFKNESKEEREQRILKQKEVHNTEDFIKRQSEVLKIYYKNTPRSRQKNSIAVKRYYLNESPEKKAKRIRNHIKSHSSINYRKNASLKSKRTIEVIKEKYPIFSIEEEMRYNPDKPLKEREIQVHCKYSECPNSKENGGWFTPSSIQISNRISDLEYEKSVGGSYFYCSDECKSLCSIFNKKYTEFLIINKDEERLYSTEDYEVFKNEVKNRQLIQSTYNYCEICGSKTDLIVHHIIPQKQEPMFSLDPENGIVLCKSCHNTKAHKKSTECSYGNLAYKYCK